MISSIALQPELDLIEIEIQLLINFMKTIEKYGMKKIFVL